MLPAKLVSIVVRPWAVMVFFDWATWQAVFTKRFFQVLVNPILFLPEKASIQPQIFDCIQTAKKKNTYRHKVSIGAIFS